MKVVVPAQKPKKVSASSEEKRTPKSTQHEQASTQKPTQSTSAANTPSTSKSLPKTDETVIAQKPQENDKNLQKNKTVEEKTPSKQQPSGSPLSKETVIAQNLLE